MKTLFRHSALVLAALFSILALHAQNYATPYTITTLAGQSSAAYVNGTGTGARFNYPDAIASDAAGNLYVMDVTNYVIRKVTPAGVVTTFAGSPGVSGSADGTGSAAQFGYPRGIASDASGTLYVADTNSQTIRKVTPAGVVTTLAGLANTSGEVDGTGSAAHFSYPQGIAVDGSSNVYVADNNGNTIRKITPAGVVTTIAGTGFAQGSTDGTGSAARFHSPTGVAVDGSGNLFVTDYNNDTIRKITPAGVVTTFAGQVGVYGGTDGTGTAATFYLPEGITINAAGTLWVACGGTIRQVTSGAVVTTLAGKNQNGGHDDGTGANARFGDATGVALDSSNNAFVADGVGNTIRQVTTGGVVTTFAGSAVSNGSADGTGAAARFDQPQGTAVDSAGNVYVADYNNNSIRKVTPAGVVTTLVPNGTALFAPTGIAVDGSGTLYVATQYSGIYQVASDGTLSAFASSGFNNPQGVAVDSSGNVYVADQSNHAIRKITSGGVLSTLAGTVGSAGAVNGTGAAARFNQPTGVAVDAYGNVYVAEFGNNDIRKITAAGVVTTLAGTAGVTGYNDGTGSAAQFYGPWGIAVDRFGYVYVAGNDSQDIRKITPDGVVTTLAGHGGAYGATDGAGNSAGFFWPQGIAVDSAGDIYVADTHNNMIRKGTPPSCTALFTATPNPAAVGASIFFDGFASHAYNGGQLLTNCSWNFGDGTGDYNIQTNHTYSAPGTYPVTLFVLDSQGLFATVTHHIVVGSTANDFNGDGNSDIVWQNPTTGDRGFWLMNGTSFSSWVDVGIVSTDWHIAATADFNSDGQADILWENTVTGDRCFWLMSGTGFGSWVDIGIVSTDWRIAAAADFNGDGQTDILWENSVTGDRIFWLMNGTSFVSSLDLGVISTSLRIVGAADFNGDGKADIVWENTSTGKRVIWFMNGTTLISSLNLGIVSTDWHIAALGDYNGDGKTDILWENTVSGDRGFWIMNGTTFSAWVDIGVVGTDWRIAN